VVATPESAGQQGRPGLHALGYVQDAIDTQLRLASKRRNRDKRKALGLQTSTVVLSATISVLLGLKVSAPIESILANVALGLGALVTVLAAVDAFFDHRALWVGRTITMAHLEALRRQLEYEKASTAGPLSSERLSFFFTALETVVKDDRAAWLELRISGPDLGRRSSNP